MSEPSEKKMLKPIEKAILYLNHVKNWSTHGPADMNAGVLAVELGRSYDTLRRLIEERGELEKKMREWKGRAKEIMDELDTDDSSGALLEDIRNFDFGKEGP